jgi:hypothetical protein
MVTLPLAHGELRIQWPEQLTAEDMADLQDWVGMWLQVLARRAEAAEKAKREAAPRPPEA